VALLIEDEARALRLLPASLLLPERVRRGT